MGFILPVHAAILTAIGCLFFAISFIQVKQPDIAVPSFQEALKQHNKDLVTALTNKPDSVNASDIMQEELTRLRLALRGRQVGEKPDIKMVLHVAMGVGDPRLPNRIAWLPALLCCNITVVVATVIIAVLFTKTLSDHINKEARHQLGEGDLHTTTHLDTILRKRKAINPHQPTEETNETDDIDLDDDLSKLAARVEKPVALAVLPIIIFISAIIVQACLLQIFQGGYVSYKIFALIRRAASLGPMECTTVLDHIVLVLNFPTQIVFYMMLARIINSFNGFFYHLFGKEEEETPMLLTDANAQ